MKTVLALATLAALAAGCVITTEDEDCTPADNFCSSPWYINYCVQGTMYGTDCSDACVEDPRVYGETCGGVPAAVGECNLDTAACACWCEDAFDRCVDDDTVEYLDAGKTYRISCSEYCDGGYCDATSRACVCS